MNIYIYIYIYIYVFFFLLFHKGACIMGRMVLARGRGHSGCYRCVPRCNAARGRLHATPSDFATFATFGAMRPIAQLAKMAAKALPATPLDAARLLRRRRISSEREEACSGSAGDVCACGCYRLLNKPA